MQRTPLRSTASQIRSISSLVVASGFSIRMSLPASAIVQAMSACAKSGVTIATASISGSAASSL